MTAVFAVIGARRDDPSALLLGDDGASDAYEAGVAPEAEPVPVAPDGGRVLDPEAEAAAREEVG